MVERNNIETVDIPILIGQIDVEDVKSSKSNHIAFSSDVHTVELLDNLKSDNTHSLFQNQNEDEGTNQQANSFTPVDEIVTNPVPNNLLEDKETADLSRTNSSSANEAADISQFDSSLTAAHVPIESNLVGVKNYACPSCKRKFSSAGRLRNHVLHCHRYKCPQCPKTLVDKKGMLRIFMRRYINATHVKVVSIRKRNW